MYEDIPITCLISIIGHIIDVFKGFRKNRGTSKSEKPASKENTPTPSSEVTVTASVVTGGIHITNNITIYHMNCEESFKFIQDTENVIVAKDHTIGFPLFMQWKQKASKYLVIGFFAYCSFGDKEKLPIWIGFQPQKPSKDNTMGDLIFSIELLKRETWRNAGMKEAEQEECGYKGKGAENKAEATYYKFFDGKTLRTDAKELYGCFCKELEEIGTRLS